jgi:Ca2+-binding EF-hand superfamily protein
MNKKLSFGIAFAVIWTSAALADSWTESFKTIDTDGSGTISQTEYDANVSKLKIDPAPTFSAIDADGNNSVDETEWSTAQKMVKAFPEGCKSSTESWCPKKY